MSTNATNRFFIDAVKPLLNSDKKQPNRSLEIFCEASKEFGTELATFSNSTDPFFFIKNEILKNALEKHNIKEEGLNEVITSFDTAAKKIKAFNADARTEELEGIASVIRWDIQDVLKKLKTQIICDSKINKIKQENTLQETEKELPNNSSSYRSN